MSTLVCAYCSELPDDWCPACRRPLCQRHGEHHRGSFDRPCIQRNVRQAERE